MFEGSNHQVSLAAAALRAAKATGSLVFGAPMRQLQPPLLCPCCESRAVKPSAAALDRFFYINSWITRSYPTVGLYRIRVTS